MGKTRPKFDLKKSHYEDNSVYLSKLIDPYTAHIAKWAYNIRLTADMVSLIGFILGFSGLFIILYYQTYYALIVAAALITLKNIGDTIDGKIARGSGIKSTYGGFTDIVFDWSFFMPLMYISLGYITGHPQIGFLVVIGYMSREFNRRKFHQKYGMKVTETSEAKKLSGIKSLVVKYDQANAQWLMPIFLIINQPLVFIYLILAIEYTLLLGELAFDYYCFFKKQEKMKWDSKRKKWINK